MHRIKPIDAATQFINEFFPDCQAAVLAGSVVRGEETPTSDLDIVVIQDGLPSAYRESHVEYGWPIEVFVHTQSSYKDFFRSDAERARPSLARMMSEGIVIVDSGILHRIKGEADELLRKGPEEWTDSVLQTKRYMLSDLLDDFIGTSDEAEALFIANAIAEAAHEFVLRTNGKWIGASKWIVRALRQYDVYFADRFLAAFQEFYKHGEREAVIQIVDEVLEPFGGRLFAGYSIGK